MKNRSKLTAGFAAVLLVIVLVSGCRPKDPPPHQLVELYEAVLEGEYETVERLLERYPSLVSSEFDFAGYQGDPLMTAALADSPDIVDLLLKKGAEPNYYADDGVTPLFVAIEHERTEIVKQLIGAGADVTWQADTGSTAIHFLAISGNMDIAEILLAEPGSIDQPKDGGFTPLALALGHYHNDLAFRFIEEGADLEKALESAPHIVPEYILNHKNEMLEYFWEQGVIDPYAMYEGNNLFHYASWSNNVTFVEELLARGLWDYTPNPAGNTPLDMARAYGSQEVIDLVTEAGFADEQ